jgi:virginiamycin B lyase
MRGPIRALMVLALSAGLSPALGASPEVRVFELPEGSGPHDVAPAPEGKIWYTAQRQGALGILDPDTGAVRQVPLGDGSAPHGVIQGPDGAAWITDGGLNAIVRFDPTDEKVEVWPLPEQAGRANLNTAAFDGRGRLWFTGQNGAYGRFDPTTRQMAVWRDPDGRGPYGIDATPDGSIWYASLAGNHIARLSEAGSKQRVDPPTEGQGARRVWADSQGAIWVSEWNSGQLSRYVPAAGAWTSWKLPGEAPRAYAVYVDERDMVWVSDFGGNVTWLFDPKSEQFTPFPGSGKGANVRQILGRDGMVYLPESGLDRIMVVRYGREGQG